MVRVSNIGDSISCDLGLQCRKFVKINDDVDYRCAAFFGDSDRRATLGDGTVKTC